MFTKEKVKKHKMNEYNKKYIGLKHSKLPNMIKMC